MIRALIASAALFVSVSAFAAETMPAAMMTAEECAALAKKVEMTQPGAEKDALVAKHKAGCPQPAAKQ